MPKDCPTDKQLLASLSEEQQRILKQGCGEAAPKIAAAIDERIVMGSKENLEKVIAQYRKATALFDVCDSEERLQQLALRIVNDSQAKIERLVGELRATAPPGSRWKDSQHVFERDQQELMEKLAREARLEDEADGDWFDKCSNDFIFSLVGGDLSRLTSWRIIEDPDDGLAVFKVGFDGHEARHWLEIDPDIPLERVRDWAEKQFGRQASKPDPEDDDGELEKEVERQSTQG